MSKKKTEELCLSQNKRKPSKLELVLGTVLGVVQLITSLFSAIDKLWNIVNKFLQ